MLQTSKLQNAKQKISKLKEKYSNNLSLIKSNDAIDFLADSYLLVENNKPGTDLSTLHVLNELISPVLEIESPRIEVTNPIDDVEHIKGKEISSQALLGNTHNLISDQHSNFSSNRSPSELSNCSKITNKTLKTESIVLSDLSNQFEHICFLSSTSDEESVTGPHQTSIPQMVTGMNSSFQSPIGSYVGNSETNKSNDEPKPKREESSSELSEVYSTVLSVEEDIYSHSASKLKEGNSYVDDAFEEREINKNASERSENSHETVSEKQQTLLSDQNVGLGSLRNTSFTEPNKELKTNILLKEKEPSQLPINNGVTKLRRPSKNYKRPEPNYIGLSLSSCKDSRKQNRYTNMGIFKVGKMAASRSIDRSMVSDDTSRPIHIGVSSSPKKSRSKYPNRSITVVKSSTSFKPSANRPVLKSCVLIGEDGSNEENKILACQKTLPSQIRGCGHEELITQLLWNQVQLTRHFIQSHHQMYLTCCQAVKKLSEKYNNSHIT